MVFGWLLNMRYSSGVIWGRRMVLNLTRSFCGKEDAVLTNRLLATPSSILIGSIAEWVHLHKRGGFTRSADSCVVGDWLAFVTRVTRDFLLHA